MPQKSVGVLSGSEIAVARARIERERNRATKSAYCRRQKRGSVGVLSGSEIAVARARIAAGNRAIRSPY